MTKLTINEKILWKIDYLRMITSEKEYERDKK